MTSKRPIPLVISLDYELFFGPRSGSVEACLITPIEQLLPVLAPTAARLTLFVDAGFLLRLKHEGERHPQLLEQFERIRHQLLILSRQGHDIQLHIHPHWEDTSFDGAQWHTNTRRYRLQDFPAEQRSTLVARYKGILESCSEKPIFAYRAGGWCVQPFMPLRNALQKNGIWLDSTTYRGGFRGEVARFFDFRRLPRLPWWRFSDDPLVEDEQGPFLEVPISSYTLSPSFFWQFALLKRFGKQKFSTFGDGQAMPNTKDYYWQRLTRPTLSPVMLDGFKAGQLENALRHHLKYNPDGVLNIMGHPKSLTPYSLKKLGEFLNRHPNLKPITLSNFTLQGLVI